jgi:hypothetical protein
MITNDWHRSTLRHSAKRRGATERLGAGLDFQP